MIEVKDYTPEHLEKIILKGIHDGERPTSIHSRALTLVQDNVPLAIFGIIYLGRSTVHIWGLVSDEVTKSPLSFVKTCKKLLAWLESAHGIKRFQLDVRTDYACGARFAEALGFKMEGVMSKFGPHTDHFLYGRVA